jgi:hypothetical protein
LGKGDRKPGDTMTSKRTIIVSLLVVLIAGVIQELTNNKPDGIRRFTGLIFLALFLAFLGEILPEITAGLSVLIAVATLLSYEGLFRQIERVTGR